MPLIFIDCKKFRRAVNNVEWFGWYDLTDYDTLFLLNLDQLRTAAFTGIPDDLAQLCWQYYDFLKPELFQEKSGKYRGYDDICQRVNEIAKYLKSGYKTLLDDTSIKVEYPNIGFSELDIENLYKYRKLTLSIPCSDNEVLFIPENTSKLLHWSKIRTPK